MKRAKQTVRTDKFLASALFRDLNTALLSEVMALGTSKQAFYGFRDFLEWLANQPVESAASYVLNAFRTGIFDASEGMPAARVFHTAMTDFQKFYLSAERQLAATTRYSQFRILRATFEKLAEKAVPGVPPYTRRQHRVGRTPYGPDDGHKSLGDTKWPELEGLEGIERHQHALRITRQSFEDKLRPYLKLYEFGKKLRQDPEYVGFSESGTGAIRQALAYCEETFRKSGHIRPPTYFNSRSGLPKTLKRTLHNPRTWMEEAGVNLDDLRVEPKIRPLRALQSCFGPSGHAAEAAVGILICDTGWNRGPAATLPKDPFIFRTSQKACIGTGEFIGNFEGRKGHDVYAYLKEKDELEGHRLELAQEIWRETVREFDNGGTNDGYAEIGCGSGNGLKRGTTPR